MPSDGEVPSGNGVPAGGGSWKRVLQIWERRFELMDSEKKKTGKTKWWILSGTAVGLFLLVTVIAIFIHKNEKEKTVTYKETKVEYGTLTAGVTKSGSVDIGTVEQTFDLDMSALQRADTESTKEDTGDRNFGNVGGMMPSGGMGASGGGTPDLFSQMLDGSRNMTGTGMISV